MRDAVHFFDNQFQHVPAQQLPDLNPFEQRTVPYLKGRVLCGMGNLSVMAARQGHSVLAVDASPAAIGHLRQRAQAENLPLQCRLAQAQAGRRHGAHRRVDVHLRAGRQNR